MFMVNGNTATNRKFRSSVCKSLSGCMSISELVSLAFIKKWLKWGQILWKSLNLLFSLKVYDSIITEELVFCSQMFVYGTETSEPPRSERHWAVWTDLFWLPVGTAVTSSFYESIIIIIIMQPQDWFWLCPQKIKISVSRSSFCGFGCRFVHKKT